MQDISNQSHPVIFDSDKKQKFGISDNGEFIDTVYREQESNKFFSKLIGRNYVQPNSKKAFTTSDIVCESYLYKKGSWMKNWKKRYFILRKDIRSLCYYHSREDLTLLGTIPLDLETQLSNVKVDDADGFEHVVAMQTENDNGSTSVTYIRFDTFEKMKAWMIDIKNEAHNIKPTDEETADWWAALFNEIEPVEPKSNVMRRDGTSSQMDSSKKQRPTSAPTTSSSSPSKQTSSQAPTSPTNSSKMTSNESVEGLVPEIQALKMAANLDSDDESDHEDNSKHEGSSVSPDTSKNLLSPGKSDPNKKHMSVAIPSTTTTTVLKPTSKKIKTMKPDKAYGPAPYEFPSVDRFAVGSNVLSGYQLSLRLGNVCGYQDRIFVVVFGSVTTDKKIAVVADTKGGISGNGGSKWTQISRTELRTVTDKPEYGENYVNDFKIHFSVLQDLIPENCKDIKIAVYRLENEMNPKEPAKATNLNMQLEIARTIISKKLFEFKPVIKIAMQVKIELPMDIAIPLFKESEVTLGVVRMTSYSLHTHRQNIVSAIKCNPYSELLYSFCTNSGQTLSCEQLFASRYSVAVAQSLLSLWHHERYDFMTETLQMLREEFSTALKEQEAKIRANLANGETLEEKITALFEPFRQAIEVMDDVFNCAIENTSVVLNNCRNAQKGEDLVNNVLSPEVGGGVLRRSVWKKITAWQYCTTNLNVHMMTSKHFTFQDVLQGAETDLSNIHYIPTITLGVPSAHELKFHEGGLRKIFVEVTEPEQKLRWMHAFQSPNLDLLKQLFASHPKEAHSLFGAKCLLASKEDLAAVLKRKYELARRIDICGSQALGCAVTSVKTVCMLASQVGGSKYLDILARSLKIGFLVMYESMLSTQGDELGMIEDMDLAVLWLSLVTLRLVTTAASRESVHRPNNSSGSSSSGETSGGKQFTPEGVPIYSGAGDGLSCRRDSVTGRLVVDLELNPQEAATVLDALSYMSNFAHRPTNSLRADVPYAFNTNPSVVYAASDAPPKVYAVVELFGLVFNQGVNEMQTLANLSSSRDVTRQVEINYGSLSRFVEFYRSYKTALEFQLDRKTPELIDILSANATIAQASFMNAGNVFNSSTNRSSAALPAAAVRSRRKSLRSSVSNAFLNNSSEGLAAAVEALKTKVLSANDRMLDQVHDAIAASTATPHDKHVNVLLKTSALCREISGTVGILCKSGKDRTSMGVTLENTRGLVEDLGVCNGQEICQTMRQQGVRRMNVYANTGQSMFAFNQIQRIALPSCFRPPPGSHAGNVTS